MADRCIDTLITHSGSFHADDLLAHAVLSTLYPEARLLRTRDAQVIAGADGTAVVFDVGFLYVPESNRFDHHQLDRPQRPEGSGLLELWPDLAALRARLHCRSARS